MSVGRGLVLALMPGTDLSQQTMWTRFEQWAATHHSALLEVLAGPAQASEIAQLERDLGYVVPDGLRALLLGHNGQRDWSMGIWPEGLDFLGTTYIAKR